MKILANYKFLGGNLRGAKSPKAKDGAFISHRLIFRVGKIRNNNTFRITKQNTNFNLTPFKILGAYD